MTWLSLTALALSASALAAPQAAPPPPPPPRPGNGPAGPDANNLPVLSQTTCQGTKYINRGLVAYGTVASDARDKVGDTLGGFGSAISSDISTFKTQKDGTVTGQLYAAPDRGPNTDGTVDYQGRIQRFQLSFKPTFDSLDDGAENLNLTLQATTLLTRNGQATTGLEAAAVIPASGRFPDLPAAVRPNGNTALALDLEGLVRLRDGSYFVSDEYGPYVYYFNKAGALQSALRPPISFIPYTDGVESFLSGNPPAGSDEDEADDPDTGRGNNHGFEGLAISPDERCLTAQLQQALIEDGGDHGTRANKTRHVTYDISDRLNPRFVHEYVLELPAVNDPTEDKNPRALDASDLHYLSRDQFFVLARDGGHGRGSGSDTPSTYRGIDIVSTRGATDLVKQDSGPAAVAVAPNGYYLPNITPDQYCRFIDINDNDDLARFGLHNGGPFEGELNEKWESMAILPATNQGPKEFYVISVSDNDYITQNGYLNFGEDQYSDGSGQNVDTQVLVWQVNLPNYQ